jgi:hypothetical protein
MGNIILFMASFLISISSFSQAENKVQSDSLSSSHATKSVRNYCKVIGWKGVTPKAVLTGLPFYAIQIRMDSLNKKKLSLPV